MGVWWREVVRGWGVVCVYICEWGWREREEESGEGEREMWDEEGVCVHSSCVCMCPLSHLSISLLLSSLSSLIYTHVALLHLISLSSTPILTQRSALSSLP